MAIEPRCPDFYQYQKPPKSLRKNRLNGRAFPSQRADRAPFGLIFSMSAAQTPDFIRLAPLGLPDRRRLATPLGNHLFMPPPVPA